MASSHQNPADHRCKNANHKHELIPKGIDIISLSQRNRSTEHRLPLRIVDGKCTRSKCQRYKKQIHTSLAEYRYASKKCITGTHHKKRKQRYRLCRLQMIRQNSKRQQCCTRYNVRHHLDNADLTVGCTHVCRIQIQTETVNRCDILQKYTLDGKQQHDLRRWRHLFCPVKQTLFHCFIPHAFFCWLHVPAPCRIRKDSAFIMAISCSNVNRNTRIQCENFNGIFCQYSQKKKGHFPC